MTESSPSFSSAGENVKIVRLSDRQKELDGLPSPKTRRWVTSRKAKVARAVSGGLIHFEEACERYRLSSEELRSWMHLLDEHGVGGLRATHVQEYRPQVRRLRINGNGNGKAERDQHAE
ncbi:MAG: DUF1153 domain-containing protein [Alphaproteobacteria bacterium]|nr:DUF1153 domain-containing protein [Alphaproteobacteria bacterium]